MKDFDTICAIATALGEGGIAIIRVSGDKALDIVSKVFKAHSGQDIKTMKSYTMKYGHIYDIDNKELTNMLKSNDSFILFTYNPYCNFKVSCESIVEEFSKSNNITVFKIPFEEFKNTKLYNTVKYAPSIVLINNGKIENYLDPNKDEDSIKYQDEKALKDYIEMYIDTKK